MLNRVAPRSRTIVPILVSMALLGTVLYFVDFGKARDALLRASPWYILPLFALMTLDRVIMAYKWNSLLLVLNVRVPYFALFRTYSASPLASIILPAAIGSDIFRVYSLTKYGAKATDVISSMIVERVVGFIAMLVPVGLSLVLASIMLRDQWSRFQSIIWAILILVLATIVVAWAMQGVVKRKIDGLAERFSNLPLVTKIHNIYEASGEYRKHPRVLAFVFALTVLEQFAPIAGILLLVNALNIDVALVALLIIIPIDILATRLPISFDGIGLSEGLYVVLFGLVGVAPTEAVLLSVSGRAVQILMALPWAIHYVMIRPKATMAPQS